eukprot:gene18354-63062_t
MWCLVLGSTAVVLTKILIKESFTRSRIRTGHGVGLFLQALTLSVAQSFPSVPQSQRKA